MSATAQQLDMFAALVPAAPPRAPFEPKDWLGRPRVQTRAWDCGGAITIYSADAPRPFEVEVRGIPCVIAYSGGVCTHAIDPPGSPFWSDTGFRSFLWPTSNAAEIVAAIERYIDAPASRGEGLGGKLTPWWPSEVLSLRQRRQTDVDYRHTSISREYRANHTRWLAEAEAKVRALGFDPEAVAPWPRSART